MLDIEYCVVYNSSMIKLKLGNLEKFRKEANLSQANLIKELYKHSDLNISIGTWQSWSSGKTQITLEAIIKIALYFNKNVHEFYEEQKEE